MITNGEESQEVIYQNWFEKHKVTKEELEKAVDWYTGRDRRFGGLTEKDH